MIAKIPKILRSRFEKKIIEKNIIVYYNINNKYIITLIKINTSIIIIL